MRSLPQSRFILLAAALTLVACRDKGNGASAISLNDFNTLIADGPTLVEIEVFPGTLDASEVHGETGEDDEKITSTISSIDTTNGIVTLALGGLQVRYDAGTGFRLASGDVSRTQWEAAVSSGTPIEARRDLPIAPQGPEDASFTADDLRVGKAGDAPGIELVIDQDNLEMTGADTGTLHVLGLNIAITPATELYDDNGTGTMPASGQFEGAVASVNVPGGTLTLAGGTVVDVSTATWDSDGDLLTLQAVADAVAGTAPVRCEGSGKLETNGVITATSIKVEVDD